MIYLFIAYTLIWVGLGWYMLVIGRKNRALSAEIEALEKLVGTDHQGAQRAWAPTMANQGEHEA